MEKADKATSVIQRKQEPLFAKPGEGFFDTKPGGFFKPEPLFKPSVQAKLSANTVGDAYEKQADTVADRVMSNKAVHGQINAGIQPAGTGIQKKDGDETPLSQADADTFNAMLLKHFKQKPKDVLSIHRDGMTILFMSLQYATPYVVSRKKGETFTEAAQATDTKGATEMVMNGPMFEGSYGFLSTTDPNDNPTQGQVYENGKLKPYTKSSSGSYHVSWSAKTKAWEFGAGDPAAGSTVAFGGGKPLIVNGLPYGNENKYKAGAPGGLPKTGDPGADNQKYLTQRSSAGYASLEKKGKSVGIPIFAINEKYNYLILLVKEDDASPGASLSYIRDSLIALGVSNALAFDGSSSATLVKDKEVVIDPADRKDNTIPFGIGIRVPH